MSEEAAHSGRILLRVPRSLHGELIAAADREGVSLNQFCAAVLAGAVKWRAPDGDERTARSRRVNAF